MIRIQSSTIAATNPLPITTIDNLPKNLSDGQKVDIVGYTDSDTFVDTWQMEYKSSGKSNIVIDDGFFVQGFSEDDYFQACDMSTAYSNRFGIETSADNSQDVIKILDSTIRNNATAHFRDLTLNMDQPAFIDLSGPLNVVSEAKFVGNTITIRPPTTVLTWTPTAMTKGDTVINVADTTGVTVGDTVGIRSPVIWETGWNYNKEEARVVVSKTATSITVNEGLLFNYDPVGTPTPDVLTITTAPPNKFSWDGGDYEMVDISDRFLSITRCFEPEVRNVNCIDPLLRRGGGGEMIWILYCCGALVEDSSFEGGRYSIFISRGSYETTVRSCTATNSWALMDPNLAAYKIYYEDCSGSNNNTLLSCHPCFEVHAKNIVGVNDNGWGFRTVGGSVDGFSLTSNVTVAQSAFNQNMAFNTVESSVDDLYFDPQFNTITYNNVQISCPNVTTNDPNRIRANGTQQTIITNSSVGLVQQISSTGGGSVTISDSTVQNLITRTILNATNMTFESAFPGTTRVDAIAVRGVFGSVRNVTNSTFNGYDYIMSEEIANNNFTNNVFNDTVVDLFLGDGNPTATIDVSFGTANNCNWPLTNKVNQTCISNSLTINGGFVSGSI